MKRPDHYDRPLHPRNSDRFARGRRPGRRTGTDRSGAEADQRVDGELAAVRDASIDEADIAAALAEFDGLWESLSLRERARVIELLVERVEYDGGEGTVSVTFRPLGVKSLADEFALKEAAA